MIKVKTLRHKVLVIEWKNPRTKKWIADWAFVGTLREGKAELSEYKYASPGEEYRLVQYVAKHIEA